MMQSQKEPRDTSARAHSRAGSKCFKNTFLSSYVKYRWSTHGHTATPTNNNRVHMALLYGICNPSQKPEGVET